MFVSSINLCMLANFSTMSLPVNKFNILMTLGLSFTVGMLFSGHVLPRFGIKPSHAYMGAIFGVAIANYLMSQAQQLS